ncbi:DUF5316 domain-containing protein [Desulfitobacterium sp. AusDCA]|uniref:DUF5316 domain-containing protein n=1 Tax=Desulfitobacterium sp. AusDCA TaxID=3240383 RepID=UPI003DA72563
MVSLGAGILTLALVCLVSFILGDWSLMFKFSGIIGLISFLISGLFTGVFVSGDRVRANWTHEDSEDQDFRQQRASKLFLFGLPNLAGAILYIVLTQ